MFKKPAIPSGSALSHRPFRRLTGAWSFSNFGDSALFLTLPIWAKDLTGSNSAAGLVFLALGLPFFLAPLAGYLADRLSRKRLVITVNLIGAAGVLSLFGVNSADDIWLLYLTTFGYGCVGYLTSAAQSGLLKDMLQGSQLAGANGLLSSIDQGLRLVTPLVGAGLYALFGGGAVAVLTASALAVAALLMATVRVRESGPAPREEREGFARELTAGARHLRSVPALGQVILVLGFVFLLSGLSNSTTFAVIDDGLGLGSEFFGVLASFQGGGSIIAGLTAGLLVRRLGERSAVGVGLACLAVGKATGLTGSAPIVAAGSAIGGLGVVWMIVGMVTLRQKLTPAGLQGRVSSLTNMSLNGPQVVGTATGAALIAVVDYRVLIAVMCAVFTLCALALMHRRAPAEPAQPAQPEAGTHRNGNSTANVEGEPSTRPQAETAGDARPEQGTAPAARA